MTSVQERIFRKSALARHSSPEGLDTLLEITTVRGWISLVALVAVVAAALIWGVLGRIPEVVNGQGIMLREGGVFRVQASGAGRIDSVFVGAGSAVLRGQTIAVIGQPELRASIVNAETLLVELRANRAKTATLVANDLRLGRASIRQQQAQADEAVIAADQQLAALNARIANERQAVDRGLLTPDVLQGTIALRAETQLRKLSMIARKQELGASAVQLEVSSNQTLFALDQTISQSANRLAQQEAQLASSAQVTSPFDGTVVERLADPGQEIGAGTPVVTIEPTAGQVQVLMLIPLEGKRIVPDLRVEMVPGGVRPEETGYFLGRVRSVSAAPLSGNALDRYLKNELLVEQFTNEGGAYLVEVSVEMDSTTVSGFKWTSREGAPIAFGSGTLLTGKIIVKQVRPLELVIPALRRWLGA